MNSALFRSKTLVVSVWCLCLPLLAAEIDLVNPHWNMVIDDAGYSDLAFDQRPGFEWREYLSGEWAGAVSFTRSGFQYGPTWLTPEFVFPDWTANSDFGVESLVQQVGFNSHGFPIARSILSNGSLRIAITSQMIDTTNGIPQGLSPRSAGGASNVMSDRYVFRQTFNLTNISGETLTSVRFFQFLHSLEAARAVYDDRIYGPAFNGHRYTISQQSPAEDPASGGLVHRDTVALHANVAPGAWEVGRYGIFPTDSHGEGKPSVGVHLSVEADALSGADFFESGTPWVGGALRCDLGTLPADGVASVEFLMSLQTRTLAAAPFRVAASNRLVAWGDNSSGQTNVPASITNTVLFAAGGRHALAAVTSSNLVAWGDNDCGQTNVPSGLLRIHSLGAGENHSVALEYNYFTENKVYAWGDNSKGQTNVPAFPGDVSDVVAGGDHCLALLYNGSVVGWGDDSAGQASAPAHSDVDAIAAGGKHSLALLYDGTVVAWGDDTHGQCAVPAELWWAEAIAAGEKHSLALQFDGTVLAWGDNSHGQTNVPAGLSDVVGIAAGKNHSVALKEDGTLVIWGDNSMGQTNGAIGMKVLQVTAGGNFNLARCAALSAINLNIDPAGTNMAVDWPAELYSDEAVGVILETTTSLSSTNWTPVATHGVVDAGRYNISIPATTNGFFRLRIAP